MKLIASTSCKLVSAKLSVNFCSGGMASHGRGKEDDLVRLYLGFISDSCTGGR